MKAIAREAGSRSKVAVASRQEGLDPVGATVGQREPRVQDVVAELSGEKINVIPWSDDPAVFVANALSPAQVISVDIDEEHRIASVTVPERMLSLAIGREGQNARLAARLTGWRIDIRSDVSVAEARAAAATEAAVATRPPAEATVSAKATAEAATAGASVAADAGAPLAPAAKPRRVTAKAAAEAQGAVDATGDGEAAPAAAAAQPKRAAKTIEPKAQPAAAQARLPAKAPAAGKAPA